MSALKRILNKDIRAVSETNLNSLGIYIDFNEENLYEAKACIVGPKDSLYEGAYLFFNIKFPKNYPFSPPDLSYVSRNKIRIHPNLYVGHHPSGSGGKVCLSILGTWSGPKWTTVMDITTVLLSIQSLLDKNPLHHEPGNETNFTKMNDYYNQVIQYDSIQTLLLKNFKDIPFGFEVFLSDMKKEFCKNKERLKEIIDSYKQKKSVIIHVPFYRISTKLNYKQLYKDFYEFYVKFE